MTTERIALPPKLLPVFSPPRGAVQYRGSFGGRGSGKSFSFAKMAAVWGVAEPLRILAVRDLQVTIKESFHAELKGAIEAEPWLAERYEVGVDYLRGFNGTEFIFRGLRHNTGSIKSLAGIDLTIVEEAEDVSEEAWIALEATVLRRPKSELWSIWNPKRRGSPVDKRFRQFFDPATMRFAKMNWRDNPRFPSGLNDLRRRQQESMSEEMYRHIWEGDYEAESDMQFIGGGLVREAMAREPYAEIGDEVIIGVDVARFGDDRTVIWPRRGRDAKTMPAIVMQGADTMAVAARVMAEVDRLRPDAVFVDEGGVGGGVVDRCRQMGYSVIGVNFGAKADRIIEGVPKCANKRAQMWATMREWLRSGASIPDDTQLEMDLTGPLYSFDPNNAIMLERKDAMKKRGVPSPDLADALALTFAYSVTPRSMERFVQEREVAEYDPVWGRR